VICAEFGGTIATVPPIGAATTIYPPLGTV